MFDPLAFQVLHISAGVMTTILNRAADRGEACSNITPRVVTLSTDLFRNELFGTRTPPPKGVSPRTCSSPSSGREASGPEPG